MSGAPDPAPLSGVVVAGGQSRRMGHDKRQLRLWGAAGPTLLEHTLAVLAPLCAELIVVLNDPAAWPALPATLVGDRFPDGGPLGGIYSGLAATQHAHALVVAADLPLLSADVLSWMTAQPRDYDVLVPRVATAGKARNRLGVESLHAIYGRACLEPMRRQLTAGNPQVIGFYSEVRVRIVEPDALAPLDPAGHSFLNVNTPAELELVQSLLTQA